MKILKNSHDERNKKKGKTITTPRKLVGRRKTWEKGKKNTKHNFSHQEKLLTSLGF